jgi:hypothetical protein
MSEKRGNTGKLIYDFPTEAVMTVQNATGARFRVSCNHFRSWNGYRELTMPIKQPIHGESFTDVPTETFVYEGPVYLEGTNKEVNPSEYKIGLVQSSKSEELASISKKRNH